MRRAGIGLCGGLASGCAAGYPAGLFTQRVANRIPLAMPCWRASLALQSSECGAARHREGSIR